MGQVWYHLAGRGSLFDRRCYVCVGIRVKFVARATSAALHGVG